MDKNEQITHLIALLNLKNSFEIIAKNIDFFVLCFQEKVTEATKKAKKEENGGADPEDDEEVDGEDEIEGEDEEYDLPYGNYHLKPTTPNNSLNYNKF